MHAGKGNFLGKDDCDINLFINILYGRHGSLYNTEHMLCVRRELLEGQDLHMVARETEELQGSLCNTDHLQEGAAGGPGLPHGGQRDRGAAGLTV